MEINKIYLASDHGGFEAKEYAKTVLEDLGFSFEDLGTNDGKTSVDYPDFAKKLALKLKDEKNSYGILICGTGIGISVAANRFDFIRCALCNSSSLARLAREHNNANVLAFGGRIAGKVLIEDMIKTFFSTEFEGGRHERRVNKLGNLNVC